MFLTKQFLNELKIKHFAMDSLYESKQELQHYNVFISYSWHDRNFASKVAYLLESLGYSVYVDFKDASLNRENVSMKTVKRIASMMDKCKCLIYLHSPSATISKWCPWELGYFSGKKKFKCLYLPLLDSLNQDFKNQEYLKIYPVGKYAGIAGKSEYEFWVHDQNNLKKYTTLKNWMNGKELTNH